MSKEIDLTDKIKAYLESYVGSEEEISEEAWAAEEKKGKTLNKPFRTPGGPKKFSVYVKNEKGNVVKVNFGDPNMSIKRDDPARRKSFRARHGCDNPGPKTKAKYWSCKMWSKKSVTKMTKGSMEYELEEEMLDFLDESEAKQGLWDNIRKKKKREGKNYKPAKPGDKDRPDPDSWKKAQKKKSDAEKEDKKEDKESGLSDKEKKLPDAIKKSILKKKGKASDCGDDMDHKEKDEAKEDSKEFKAHPMYDPKTGKKYIAKTYSEHMKYKKLGYTHNKSESGWKKKK
jgi:hypothetical protein